MISHDALSFRVIVTLYARHGEHCRTAQLIYRHGVPADVQRACDRARAAYLEARGDARGAA